MRLVPSALAIFCKTFSVLLLLIGCATQPLHISAEATTTAIRNGRFVKPQLYSGEPVIENHVHNNNHELSGSGSDNAQRLNDISLVGNGKYNHLNNHKDNDPIKSTLSLLETSTQVHRFPNLENQAHAKPLNTIMLDLGSKLTDTSFQEVLDQARQISSVSSEEDNESSADIPDVQFEIAKKDMKGKIVKTAKSILDEKKWLDDVDTIITEYTQKTSRVKAHLKQLRMELKNMVKATLKVENKQMMSKLKRQLETAKADLETLNKAAKSQNSQQNNFQMGIRKITSTIGELESQLKVLKTDHGK